MAMFGQVILPAPLGSEGYVELAGDANVLGHRWRKHILNLGTLIHPKTGERLSLDEDFYGKLKRNFESGVSEVAVPLADDQNNHSEDPLRNAGEVVGISREGKKVYVDLDIRDPKVHEGLKNRTLLGASAYLSMNYRDSRSGEKVGPALLNSCITNRPYVVGLDPYEEVIAATADGMEDAVVLTPEAESMTRDEMLAALKAEHGIDVEALQSAAANAGELADSMSQLTAALQSQGGLQLSASGDDGTLTLTDITGAISELASLRDKDAEEIAKLTRAAAEREVDGYVSQGRVLPRQRDVFVGLALTNRDMLDQLLPDQPLVALSAQAGVSTSVLGQPKVEDIDGEVARLTSSHTRFFTPASANGNGRH